MEYPKGVIGVCPNCNQWQHEYTGDCFHDCAKRGFAKFAKTEPIAEVSPEVADAFGLRGFPNVRILGKDGQQ